MEAAWISFAGTLLVAMATLLFSQWKEREAAWRGKKLAYYEEFIASYSGVLGHLVPAVAKIRFANSVNQLHLIGSQSVIDALHKFLNEVAESNQDSSQEQRDQAWSNLIWLIRKDLGDRPSLQMGAFEARLWDSGTGSNTPLLPTNNPFAISNRQENN
jgi:hypothetical protein